MSLVRIEDVFEVLKDELGLMPTHWGGLSTESYNALERTAAELNDRAMQRVPEMAARWADDRYDEGYDEGRRDGRAGSLDALTEEARKHCAEYESRARSAELIVEQMQRYKAALEREIDQVADYLDQLSLKHSLATGCEIGMLEEAIK